jgi:hypothetical protein
VALRRAGSAPCRHPVTIRNGSIREEKGRNRKHKGRKRVIREEKGKKRKEKGRKREEKGKKNEKKNIETNIETRKRLSFAHNLDSIGMESLMIT